MIACIHCGARVWWSFPRSDDPCWKCKRHIAGPAAKLRLVRHFAALD